MEKIQLNKENPPRSPTICGIAVETIVLSIAASAMVIIKAASIQPRCLGEVFPCVLVSFV